MGEEILLRAVLYRSGDARSKGARLYPADPRSDIDQHQHRATQCSASAIGPAICLQKAESPMRGVEPSPVEVHFAPLTLGDCNCTGLGSTPLICLSTLCRHIAGPIAAHSQGSKCICTGLLAARKSHPGRCGHVQAGSQQAGPQDVPGQGAKHAHTSTAVPVP